jgi:2-polyprenyl-3-methyl-5-hydroxy-6-metoxy-1,4-benzoquinol methylase
MELIEMLGVSTDDAVIDVGGGASLLVDSLIGRGWSDVTVLDISHTALEAARERLGSDAPVTWLDQDLLTWSPERHYGLWHDRAVFHFLVDAAERETYLRVLRAAVAPGGSVILATFASDGPEYCSGLPVVRYSAEDLATILAGTDFEVVESRCEEHTTPGGAVQPFTWVAGRATR